MLLSKDTISDVIGVIRPADHCRPANQLIREAILDLYGRGEPSGAITVANEFTRRGENARVGGSGLGNVTNLRLILVTSP
jgi:replicative DNA helicase